MSSPQPRPNGPVKDSSVTRRRLQIRNVQDALFVLEAVRSGLLHLVERPAASKQCDLKSGDVYVWETKGNPKGRLHWRDGRQWSTSRSLGKYFLYDELTEKDLEEARATGRILNRIQRSSDPKGLRKQTLTVNVKFPGTTEPRKWHVVAYFLVEDIGLLPVIEKDDVFRKIFKVPNGVFLDDSGNDLCPQTDEIEKRQDEDQYSGQEETHNHPSSSTFSHPPLPLASPVHSPQLSPQSATSSAISLPPFSSFGTYNETPHLLHPSIMHPPILPENFRRRSPRSPEDQLALHRFKVVHRDNINILP